jgi:hypothetical protein
MPTKGMNAKHGVRQPATALASFSAIQSDVGRKRVGGLELHYAHITCVYSIYFISFIKNVSFRAILSFRIVLHATPWCTLLLLHLFVIHGNFMGFRNSDITPPIGYLSN